jgi:hypothetical protein
MINASSDATQELTFHESGMFTINSSIAPTIILFVFLVLFTRLLKQHGV